VYVRFLPGGKNIKKYKSLEFFSKYILCPNQTEGIQVGKETREAKRHIITTTGPRVPPSTQTYKAINCKMQSKLNVAISQMKQPVDGSFEGPTRANTDFPGWK